MIVGPAMPSPITPTWGGACAARELLVEDRLEAVRRARAAVLLRPGQPGVAGLVELAAPLAHERVVEPLRAAAAAALVLREVRVDPRAQLGAELGFLRRVAQIHAREANADAGAGTSSLCRDGAAR